LKHLKLILILSLISVLFGSCSSTSTITVTSPSVSTITTIASPQTVTKTFTVMPPALTETVTTTKNITTTVTQASSSPLPATKSPMSVPLNITLDYFGIYSTHQPTYYFASNTIQLIAIVEDGVVSNKYFYPLDLPGIAIKAFSLQDLEQQIILNTPSVGDHLTLSLLAYSCEDRSPALDILKALANYSQSAEPLEQFVESLPQNKQLIGYYSHTWYQADNWGISASEYHEIKDDVAVWFRIWSSNEPAPIPTPYFLPNVKIQSVTLPTNAKVSTGIFVNSYSTTFVLTNTEKVDVTVHWRAHSSVTGEFDDGDVTVQANQSKTITLGYHYSTAGMVALTYSLEYENSQIDTWSGTMNVSQ
jgi:hypothetical protein